MRTKIEKEGEAIFYRTSALTLESRHDFSMRDAIPALEEFRGLLEAFPLLDTIVRERLTTVAQVAVFSPSSASPSRDGGGGRNASVGGAEGGEAGAKGGKERQHRDEEKEGEEGEEEEGSSSPVRYGCA